MLKTFSDSTGTLILRRDAQGNVAVQGRQAVALGYEVTGSGTAEGVWARWTWNGSSLIVENDRFGFLPVYYATVGGGFGISTSVMELIDAGADPALDDRAIAVFLRLGHYIGDDTPFRSIRQLAPGSRLIWTDNRLQIESTAPPLELQPSSISRSRAIDLYGERFQQAVENMLPSPEQRMCVPLSAGRDSRHILYALLRAGRRPDMVVTARSAPPRPSTDAAVAAQIAAATGLPHTIVDQSQDRFADELEKDLMTNFCADEHAQMVPVARWLQAERMDVSWDGIAGDIFSCGVYDNSDMLELFREHHFPELASSLLGKDLYLSRSLAQPFRERWSREAAVSRLGLELEKYAGLPNPVAPFFFFNRVRRELALCPYGMLNRSCLILAPYLSHSVFDLLINLPLEFFQGRQFHSEAIDQFYPELPQYEYISTPGGFVNESRGRILRFARRMGVFAAASPGQSCIRKRFLLPRLAKGIMNQAYGTEMPVLFSRILVMLHLERSLTGVRTSQVRQ